MKKVLKIIGIVLLCLVLIWCIYVTIDCIRLRTIKLGLKPIITLEHSEENNRLNYTGLVYNVSYYIDKKQDYDLILYDIYGAEFRLFDKLLIWAWVE